jgi:SAM-dependent methyltransferase
MLTPETHFELGLDVGCGTGYSAIALASYCNAVHAIERSPSMLKHAVPAPNVTYVTGSAESIPVASESVDIVAFGGVLFYADVERALVELFRVCKSEATVLVYDFEVDTESVMTRLGLAGQGTAEPYDHTANFSGIEPEPPKRSRSSNERAQRPRLLEALMTGQETVTLHLSALELSHVLMADSNRLRLLRKAFGDDTENSLETLLGSDNDGHVISAQLYFTKYILHK